MDRDFKHVVSTEAPYTLVTTGISDSGVVAKLTLSWPTAEKRAENLEKAKASLEEYIINLEKDDDTVYAGAAAENAVSRLKRYNLPFRSVLTVGMFKNHEYDEVAFKVGPFKLKADARLTGGIDFRTVKLVHEKQSKGFTVGIGGASSAWYAQFNKAAS